MALVKFAFLGLCVSLAAVIAGGASSASVNGDGDDDLRSPKLSFANANKASSKTVHGDGDDEPLLPKTMPSGADMYPSSGLRGNGFEFGFGYGCNVGGACQNPNGPVTVVEYPCPGYVSICDPSPSPCYPNPPSYGCQPCNQAQVNTAQKVNMKNWAQDFPKEATHTMPRVTHKQ